MSSTETTPTDYRPFRERVAEDQAQVIAFRVGGEWHACDVQLVEEVVTRSGIHPLPDMPPRLLGVLRLRGELVPVLERCWPAFDGPLLYYPGRRYLPAPLRAFVDFIQTMRW